MNEVDEIIVVDTGTAPIVGILSVGEGNFTVYLGNQIPEAIDRIILAKEVIVYGGETRDGEDYDLAQLGKFAGLPGELPFSGRYTDMRRICWPWAQWGSGLSATYNRLFPTCPEFPDTYEGSVQRDCYMGWKLWERWKAGTLTL
jgi:hypothetical protein